HPLVSPTLVYLRGLLPLALFVIVSDWEVLRDEILFTSVDGFFRAHHTVNPVKYPMLEAVKKLYPAYEGIKSR
ncbi:hypothetical protein EDB86DRAFT_2783587, partial [Lactarius hatsudake]